MRKKWNLYLIFYFFINDQNCFQLSYEQHITIIIFQEMKYQLKNSVCVNEVYCNSKSKVVVLRNNIKYAYDVIIQLITLNSTFYTHTK